MAEDEGQSIVIQNLRIANKRLSDENKLLNFKIKSVMAKNERLEKDLNALRQKVDENNWSEIEREDENGPA